MTPAQLHNEMVLVLVMPAIILAVMLLASDALYCVRRWWRHREARLRMEEYVARTTLLAESARKGGAK